MGMLQLWGNPSHMRNIAKSLREQYSTDDLYLLLAKQNSGSFTYDGIERGGERVCAEIEQQLRDIESSGGKIKKLSIVGYSLGGLISRYAIGLLDAKGILDTVECMVSTSNSGARPPSNASADSVSELYHVCLPTPRRPNTS